MPHSRRTFLATGLGLLATRPWAIAAAGAVKPEADLVGEVGITTGSFNHQLAREPERFQLPGLFSIVRDELDMRVVDVFTPSLASFEPAYLDRVRAAANKAGCLLTNLKLNQKGLDLGSPDPAVRGLAVAEYKRSIDAAQRLGMRWVRPLPRPEPPNAEAQLASFRELADYASARNVRMLVENFGWMMSDPDSVVRLVKDLDGLAAASPDTGNWTTNEVRYDGLTRTFPFAVTCDFKAKDMGPGGEHPEYDLERCFQIGWDAGFRGPWCIEHGHADEKTALNELRTVRDRLKGWIAARS